MSAKQRKRAAAANRNHTPSDPSSPRSQAAADEAASHAALGQSDPFTPSAALSAATPAGAAAAGLARPPTVSSFIGKLYAIVSNPATQHVVCWADHGHSFLVRDEHAFALHIMRLHFRHSNFSSFVRQLNFYGFHRRSTPSAVTQFDHPNFKRGREELLPLIVRKSAGHGGSSSAGNGLSSSSGPSGVAAAEGEGKPKPGSGKEKGGGDACKDDIRQLGQQVRQLKSQYEELAKMQQRILFVFSRYVNAEQGGRRKRYVSEAADDEEGGGSGSGGGTAKKARLLIEDIETRTTRNEAAVAQNGAHGSASSGSRGARRASSLISPLADINWNDQHAMQDLIHSPYMRGAPAVLNNTPLPIELPPLQSNIPTAAVDRRSRSPRPLLLTRGEEREAEDERRVNLLPRIDVPPRASVRKATGKFYDAGDSPSSQSSTSTEGETDRRARALSLSHPFGPPSDLGMLAWNNTAHVARNGIIYAPPATPHIDDISAAAASLPLSPHLPNGTDSGAGREHDSNYSVWPNGGAVKAESDFVLPPTAYSYTAPNSPPLEHIPLLSDAMEPPTLSASDRSHLALAAPIIFPPSPLPLSLPSSPLSSPLPVASVDGLPSLLSAASSPTRFPLSPFLTPSARPFKPEPASS